MLLPIDLYHVMIILIIDLDRCEDGKYVFGKLLSIALQNSWLHTIIQSYSHHLDRSEDCKYILGELLSIALQNSRPRPPLTLPRYNLLCPV